MPFDLSHFRTAGLFWVVHTRDGRSVPGLITTIGDGEHADIRVEQKDASAVTIANDDIVAIAPPRASMEDDEDGG